MKATFDCGRTCPLREECKFGAPLRAVGGTRVHSHTIRVKVEFRDVGCLARAASRMGATVLGEGSHKLYGGAEAGFGLQLPGWKYPVVLRADGTLAFDDYNGAWGTRADVERLTEFYALEAAKQAAEAQGWMTETTADGGLLVYHPDGGTLKVDRGGKVEAFGFLGQGCADATEAVASAMGRKTEENVKAEFFAERAKVQLRE